uniref:Uncharacterized protein n=1 Tax=Avena sativa TaxID=4498 RepID=A0ACD5Z1Q1_AVESA
MLADRYVRQTTTLCSTNFKGTALCTAAANWPLQTSSKQITKQTEGACSKLVYSPAGPPRTETRETGRRETWPISLGSPEQQVHHLGRLAVLPAPPQLPPRHRRATGTGQLLLPLLAAARLRRQETREPPPALAPVAHVSTPALADS